MSENVLDLDDLQELLWSFAGHRVVTVAGRTGILGYLAQQTATPEQVAGELGLDPLATGKMVRALTALGLVEHTAEGYRVVPALAPHLAPGPDDIAPFLEHSHMMYERWGESLEPWLRGEPWIPHPRRGSDIRRFGAAMRGMAAELSRLLVQALDLTDVRRVLDVGGSYGHYAMALCRARPDLTAVVLDRPEVAELAREALAGDPLEARIEYVGGDYLASDYGEGYDLVLCANILHQESGERAAALMARCGRALAPGGRLVVMDFAIDEAQERALVGALFAINMRSFGDTHTEGTIRGWMEAAGLGEVTRIDLNRHRWLIVGRRPR
jgi:SAM-dependent methyltransferase